MEEDIQSNPQLSCLAGHPVRLRGSQVDQVGRWERNRMKAERFKPR